MRKELYQLLAQLMNSHRIDVNEAELKLQLLSHPTYPSLHAVTGVLDHFGVTNLALKLPVQQAVLPDLPDCFMANMQLGNSEKLLVLVEKRADQFNITNGEEATMLIPQEEFLQRWDGVILAVERDEKLTTLSAPKRSFYHQLLYLGLVLLLGYFALSQLSLFTGLHFSLSVLGFIFSALIVQHELGFSSPATEHFCQQSATTSCQDVLQSDGASLFNFLKLSDLSIVVFSSFLLYWCFYFLTASFSYDLMVLLNCAALPVVLYSLYYQYWIVKKWCPLCLAIAGVLVLQFIALWVSEFSLNSLKLSFNGSLIFLLSLFLTLGAWDFVKNLLLQQKELAALQLKHYKFKRNFTLFKALHQEKKSLGPTPSIPQEMILGNVHSPLEIILVTSPLCFYCKDAHRDLMKLLKVAGKQIKVTIRFNFRVLRTEDLSYRVASQLLAIFHQLPEQAFEQAMEEVYSDDVDLEAWLATQTLLDSQAYASVLQAQFDWCRSNEINFTPAFFVDGKQFPVEYEREDLAYFIEDLLENQTRKSTPRS